jgi:hypothetical protein
MKITYNKIFMDATIPYHVCSISTGIGVVFTNIDSFVQEQVTTELIISFQEH